MEHRHQEALHLTQRAVLAAQRVYAPESLYQWQWQTGRLRHALGDIDAAIAAYERAVETLQSIRYELLSDYGKSRASFREALGPVYFELVDLLLQRAAAGAGTGPVCNVPEKSVIPSNCSRWPSYGTIFGTIAWMPGAHTGA